MECAKGPAGGETEGTQRVDEKLRGQEGQQAPDVSSDRSAPAGGKPGGKPEVAKTPPLKIREIEDLEDDAKGG